MPFFLCKITNPDQSKLKFDEEGDPCRGSRTFAEIAHYVRCIPYMTREGIGASENYLWTSPDFTSVIKVGSEDDHALLMASIFRTCKMETYEEYKEFEDQERGKLKSKNYEDEQLLNVDDDGPAGKEEEPTAAATNEDGS